MLIKCGIRSQVREWLALGFKVIGQGFDNAGAFTILAEVRP